MLLCDLRTCGRLESLCNFCNFPGLLCALPPLGEGLFGGKGKGGALGEVDRRFPRYFSFLGEGDFCTLTLDIFFGKLDFWSFFTCWGLGEGEGEGEGEEWELEALSDEGESCDDVDSTSSSLVTFDPLARCTGLGV